MRGQLHERLAAAATAGRYGEVIRLARISLGLSQVALGKLVGYSQPVISKIENGNTAGLTITVARALAVALEIDPALLGVAEQPSSPGVEGGEPPVRRREFLAKTPAATAITTANFVAAGAVEFGSAGEAEQRAGVLQTITLAHRKIEGMTPAAELVEATEAHCRLIGSQAVRAHGEGRAALALAASEAAGLAGWVRWDLGDLGSAKSHYRCAVKAAMVAQHPTAAAYMAGTLAGFEIATGSPLDAWPLIVKARHLAGPEAPATALAWLDVLEAFYWSTAGNAVKTLRLLDRAEETAEGAGVAVWPWVFTYTPAKVHAQRLASMIQLKQPQKAQTISNQLLVQSETTNPKQAASLLLSHAQAALLNRQSDAAVSFGIQALDMAAQVRSTKIITVAKQLRAQLAQGPAPASLGEFLDRLTQADARL